MIRLLALDIDGVLTDGSVLLDEDGRESKTLFYRDLDALTAARNAGIQVVLVSAEATPLANVIARRLGVEDAYTGAKDKLATLRAAAEAATVQLSETCYVADAPRDVAALEAAGLGLAPADAAPEAVAAADRVLTRAGGRGAVAEAVGIILASLEP